MRFLIIDDDECQLDWCSKQLRQRGCEVETALSGEEGLNLYKTKGPWDVVLSDYLFLPSRRIRNGLDLVRAILAINSQQVIVIHTSEKDLHAPVPVLHKPYRLDDLLRLLRKPLPCLSAAEKRKRKEGNANAAQ